MRVTDKMVLFWGGPFSQWYDHEMEIDGITYNTAEQYMMASKARHFKDEETLAKILATGEPSVQKALGRKVKNFNAEEWSAVAKEYVAIANINKFKDPELRLFLLGTGNREIVEASPTDRIWGIGLGEKDPRALDKSQWQGTNWLGEVLMDVREMIKSCEPQEPDELG